MNNPNKLAKYMKAPYRGLLRARDSYVSCFTGCAGRSRYGPMMGHPARAISAAPRGFSFNSHSTSGDDDIGDLIRSASKASIRASPANSNASRVSLPTRTQSLDIGRIDEDSEFIDDVLPGKMHPRSQSYDVRSNRSKLTFAAA
ncbi:uncharacterized protein LOC120279137 [Dioscorea cayenensis subsp. rotundata]|uniref:Uncharacterized protein LOC120279137 n=1 Tax=Dioscorea cayennensis subsp. rotundata TaxID=55577 RepID=A0AB40CRB5_DIOCR|nr:uncharacterized protein LOC120279137 [Dioscorea cayenensis subsp. rotundata]